MVCHRGFHQRESPGDTCCCWVNLTAYTHIHMRVGRDGMRWGDPGQLTAIVTGHRTLMMTSSNGNIFRVTGHSPVNSPHKRPVTQSFDVFFDLRLNKRLSKQSWGRWFEMTSRPLWCHCNVSLWAEKLINFITRRPEGCWSSIPSLSLIGPWEIWQ